MPTYAFVCERCLTSFDIRATFAQLGRGLDVTCPQCGGREVRREWSAPFIRGRGDPAPRRGGSGACGPGSGSGCCGSGGRF